MSTTYINAKPNRLVEVFYHRRVQEVYWNDNCIRSQSRDIISLADMGGRLCVWTCYAVLTQLRSDGAFCHGVWMSRASVQQWSYAQYRSLADAKRDAIGNRVSHKSWGVAQRRHPMRPRCCLVTRRGRFAHLLPGWMNAHVSIQLASSVTRSLTYQWAWQLKSSMSCHVYGRQPLTHIFVKYWAWSRGDISRPKRTINVQEWVSCKTKELTRASRLTSCL